MPVIAAAPHRSSCASGPATRLVRVVLGTSCTIQEAAPFVPICSRRPRSPDPTRSTARACEQVDTAGVQLIVAFALDCLEKGVAYKWIGRSPTLEKAIELLGVGALLEYPA